MLNKKIKLFLVDDDVLFLKSLEIEFLVRADFEITTFATGELCIEAISSGEVPDVIILDYYLNGISKYAINGIETLDKLKKINENIPVIMLSCQDKIEVAIDCMHHKAYDYVVKSETSFFRLQNILTAFFELKKISKQLNWYMDRI